MQYPYKRTVLILISIATIVRLFLATQLELGNDEVYYWTYVVYSFWSHFNYTPIVGLMVQVFSLNFLLKEEFFMPLGPIVLSSTRVWIRNMIGTKIKNE